MQRAFVSFLLVMLIVLAGCSGVFGGDGEPTATLTPAPVPTDEPTPIPVPRLAPGITNHCIENPSALVAAHGSVLRNTSFSRTSNTTIATNGSVLVRQTSMLRAGPDGKRFYFVSEQNVSYGYPGSVAFPVRTEGWSNGEQAFVKRTYTNGTTTYDRLNVDAEELRYNVSQGNLRYLLDSFGSNNTAVTERLTRSESTLYRINGTSRLYAPENTSLRLLVDDRGVVHRYQTVRETPSDENVSHSVSKTRFSKIGKTEASGRPS